MPQQKSIIQPESYESFLSELKTRIRTAQVKASLAVNKELILLYWQIGTQIVEKQKEEGWGTKVIPKLAKDLRIEFPNIKGLSARNLGYMKSFAIAWPDDQFLHQLGAKIPWKHNCLLIEKVKSPEARQWYIKKLSSMVGVEICSLCRLRRICTKGRAAQLTILKAHCQRDSRTWQNKC